MVTRLSKYGNRFTPKLTMYELDGFLVANPIHRYLRGTLSGTGWRPPAIVVDRHATRPRRG
jgi:hypothetical protein